MKMHAHSSLWPMMRHVVPEGESGRYAVKHFEVDSEDAFRFNLGNLGNGWGTMLDIRPGKYAKLVRKPTAGGLVPGALIMSDTNMERATNTDVLLKAHGRVLVVGLGLGMVVTAMALGKKVHHIDVVEKSSDVVHLVWPHVREVWDKNKDRSKARLHQEDIHSWRYPGMKWNTIYFDIWDKLSVDNLPEIARLHQRFKSRLIRPEHWMGSWVQNELRADLKREQRSWRF